MSNPTPKTTAVQPPADAGCCLRLRWLQERYAAAGAQPATHEPLALSDADRYCWIRANRGHPAIADALEHSDHDCDFDARIEAAIHLWLQGRHFHAELDDIRPDAHP